jgi:predicted transcriptional regulator
MTTLREEIQNDPLYQKTYQIISQQQGVKTAELTRLMELPEWTARRKLKLWAEYGLIKSEGNKTSQRYYTADAQLVSQKEQVFTLAARRMAIPEIAKTLEVSNDLVKRYLTEGVESQELMIIKEGQKKLYLPLVRSADTTEASIYTYVAAKPGCTVKDLIEYTGKSRDTIHLITKKLERAGDIEHYFENNRVFRFFTPEVSEIYLEFIEKEKEVKEVERRSTTRRKRKVQKEQEKVVEPSLVQGTLLTGPTESSPVEKVPTINPSVEIPVQIEALLFSREKMDDLHWMPYRYRQARVSSKKETS